VKPLLSVICYNRLNDTTRTIQALRDTYTFDEAEVLIVDNASVDGTGDWLLEQVDLGLLKPENVMLLDENIGCPRALNLVLESQRKPGQHFIKVDNDVLLVTPGWVEMLVRFLDQHPNVAMASPWYAELETGNQGRVYEQHAGWWRIFPVIGHCCVHRGEFLDQTGFFDVLGDDHLYGFEDNLMAHRAGAMGLDCAIVTTVVLENIQRHNSLDDGCGSIHPQESMRSHVDRFRAEYNRRAHRIHDLKGHYHVGADGREAIT